jgi:hypothetical protein
LFDIRAPERKFLTELSWPRILECEVFLSDVVMDELRAAPRALREKMLDAVSGFTVLPEADKARVLAQKYVDQNVFPAKYFDDALHVATASANRIEILLSWNFVHLVKLKTRRLVALLNTAENYAPVEIISPPEL